ncbi:ADP-ribosylation [Stereum hirsutum FP-91666 SS1]|uniref:ADP-ribosylation n=1 Tax=Stereum hirsutum (strain FP-91666) TaxID=721885 RepID=UPI000444A7CD|nr:ADP-ribosylation [Stereum hirsutum FP-91666 SS1]EIM80823.1 ADP-ribosylation [Stereum hirsutum FP-91666 SS1]
MFHPFCGKTCATFAKAHVTPPSGTEQYCLYCNRRPRYKEPGSGILHPFCGKGCATMAKNAGANLTAGSPPPVNTSCLQCRRRTKQPDSHYCSRTCHNQGESAAPGILEIPGDHITFRSVVDQFMNSWKHATLCPSVKRVYLVVSTKVNLQIYRQYLDEVESRGQFKAKGKTPGNENRRWHGTLRACNLGDDPSYTALCYGANCSVCGIIKSSYDIQAYMKGTGWGRFGKGIYTSATSSKSDAYARRAGSTPSPYKAMFLNKVVVGNGYKVKHDMPSFTAPPAGYDSVLAEVGGSLNYDELVVYTDKAIRPSYLVLYDA